MATARRKPLTIPQHGEIKGGQCHGWRYLFLGFAVVDGALRVRARITSPLWPFPHDGLLKAAHFGSFRAVVGERAKRLPADKLITEAYYWAQLPEPAWGDRHRTIRARVMRSANTGKTRP